MGRAPLVAVVALAALLAAQAHASARSIRLSLVFLPEPVLEVGKPSPVAIRVTNRGSDRAVRVFVRLRAPAWVELGGRGCTRKTTALVCRLGDLRPGQSRTARMTVTPTRSSTYRLVATAAAEESTLGGTTMTTP